MKLTVTPIFFEVVYVIYLFIMLFSIYNNEIFFVCFLQELSAATVCICVCLRSTLPVYLRGVSPEAASHLWQ